MAGAQHGRGAAWPSSTQRGSPHSLTAPLIPPVSPAQTSPTSGFVPAHTRPDVLARIAHLACRDEPDHRPRSENTGQPVHHWGQLCRWQGELPACCVCRLGGGLACVSSSLHATACKLKHYVLRPGYSRAALAVPEVLLQGHYTSPLALSRLAACPSCSRPPADQRERAGARQHGGGAAKPGGVRQPGVHH